MAGQGVGGGLGPQRQVLCVIKVQLISIKIADQDKVIKQTNKVNKQQTNPNLNTVDMCVQVHVNPTLL